jgi:hypothetical protein
MYIREEVEFIERTTGKSIKNIEQFKYNKHIILDLKTKFHNEFNYTPTIAECVYLIENELSSPEKCLNDSCEKYGKFNRNRYNYCCRNCSDIDPKRNEKIQSLRKSKIDYAKVHEKVVETKNKIGMDGLNVHQRTGKKTLEKRNTNYNHWYEKTIDSIKKRSKESRVISTSKRRNTIYEKYGVTHFGGGYSKLKRIVIEGKEFLYQGYEDVALYELVYEQNFHIDDIVSCVRYNEHKFKYEKGYYFPDFYIKSQKKYIEIKSKYWESKDEHKELKKECVLNCGFNYERIVYDDKIRIKKARNALREKNCYIEK